MDRQDVTGKKFHDLDITRFKVVTYTVPIRLVYFTELIEQQLAREILKARFQGQDTPEFNTSLTDNCSRMALGIMMCIGKYACMMEKAPRSVTELCSMYVSAGRIRLLYGPSDIVSVV